MSHDKQEQSRGLRAIPSSAEGRTGKQKSSAASHPHIDTDKEATRTQRVVLQVQGSVVAIKHPCILSAPSKHH